MKFGDYLKEKIPLICAYFSVLILILIVLFAFNLYYTGIIMIMFLLFVLGIILFFYQFYQKKLFYDKLYILLGDLDNKALIHETVGEASFIDGRILLDILRETDKYKLEQINKYKYMQEEFQEFMELWVHEIKTPLAAINLICENNKSKVTNSINEESLKIDGFIEMILFYARSQMPEKDYLIKMCKLTDIVNKVIIRNKNSFLEKNIRLDMRDLNVSVRTDSKWMEFIINQIIVNSIKYTQDNPLIEIYSVSDKESVSLIIQDNGIGISAKDLPRVFEKGFTGENGRSKYNSTGMGLYLVKKLCLALGNNVLIDSTLGVGTTVKIVFPIGSFTDKMIGDGNYGTKSKE